MMIGDILVCIHRLNIRLQTKSRNALSDWASSLLVSDGEKDSQIERGKESEEKIGERGPGSNDMVFR